jgi:hypothetical protein
LTIDAFLEIARTKREIFKRIYLASQIWLIPLVQFIASPPDTYFTKIGERKKEKYINK